MELHVKVFCRQAVRFHSDKSVVLLIGAARTHTRGTDYNGET